MNQIFVLYINDGDHPRRIRTVTQERYGYMSRMQPLDRSLHKTLIHRGEGDVVIDIIAITIYENLDQKRAQAIEQEVIHWLANQELIPRPETME